MAVAPQNIMAQLRGMPDAELAKYAAMHKNDPFIFPLAFQESQTRKHLRAAKDMQMAGVQQPKVVDQDLQQMMPQPAPVQQPVQLPENIGIGQLPAQNLTKMAGGGIVAFAGGGTPFAQWLAERGITMQQYAQLPATEQQLMREVFRNPGPTMPAAAAPVAAEAAAPVAAEAATTGRAYKLGRTLGTGLAKTGPVLAGTEVVSNLGSYKFKEPGLDTSVGGVYDAIKRGDYSQAGRNLVMGLPEAGYDVARGIAGIGDYVLPGQPLAEGVDKAVKYFHGDNITTPSDTARKATNAAAAKTKEDYKVTEGTPTGNVMGSRRTPLQLAEEAANKPVPRPSINPNAAANKPGAGAPAQNAATPAANSGLSGLAAYVKEGNDYTGPSPLEGQKARLDKQEEQAVTDKKDALNMALMKAGLGMMAGRSQYALQNIAEGGKGGLEDYAASMKDLRQAAKERDKMRNELENAAYAYKRDDVKGYQTHMEKAQDRAADLQRTQMQVDATLKAAQTSAGAQLAAAQLPPREAQMAAMLGTGKTFEERFQSGLPKLTAIQAGKFDPRKAYSEYLVAAQRANTGEIMPYAEFAMQFAPRVSGGQGQVLPRAD